MGNPVVWHAHANGAAFRVQQQARLLGLRSDDEVAALLAACDVLCLPSLERTEAFGLVLLEAMRFAKPVVVSAVTVK